MTTYSDRRQIHRIQIPPCMSNTYFYRICECEDGEAMERLHPAAIPVQQQQLQELLENIDDWMGQIDGQVGSGPSLETRGSDGDSDITTDD